MKALILSGGTGTRLRPLTYSKAKQLLPLVNKPVLIYLIEKIARAGIHDIGIIVGDTQEQVKKTVGSGEAWGTAITYIHQHKSLGLAHAVRTAADFLGRDDFVMILGDNIFNMELDSFIQNFYQQKANTSVLLHTVSNPSQFGVAVVKDGFVTALYEKPEKYISNLIITGVYAFDHSIFAAIDRIKPSRRGELEITDAIQNQLKNGARVTCDLVRGWWKDTGKLNDILEANRLMFDAALAEKVQMGNNVTIRNSIIQGPVHLDDDAVITDSFIGPYTTVGRRTRITECEIENCIILEDTQLANVSKKISGSLIGNQVSIQGSPENSSLVSTFFLGDHCQIDL
ncbi:MAG: glucose-1-phosphate thymidylyltransferase [Dehalobacter sp.]|nr:glucose-1-phosphate thymidylyltransferase [Dehalobacter sp.]